MSIAYYIKITIIFCFVSNNVLLNGLDPVFTNINDHYFTEQSIEDQIMSHS